VQLKKQKAKAKNSGAEVWRLNKLRSPQLHDATVIRVTDADAPTKAFIGIKKTRDRPGVVSTGTDDKTEAARVDDILKRTLADEPLADSVAVEEQIEKEQRQWSAYEQAIEFLTREIDKEKAVLAIQYSKQLKPQHDELMRKLCKPLLEFHAAYCELYALKRHLIDNEVGLRGLCLTLPDFLSEPSNKYSEMADFFRALKRENYIKEVPKELRLS
jgi:hypothetical protein